MLKKPPKLGKRGWINLGDLYPDCQAWPITLRSRANAQTEDPIMRTLASKKWPKTTPPLAQLSLLYSYRSVQRGGSLCYRGGGNVSHHVVDHAYFSIQKVAEDDLAPPPPPPAPLIGSFLSSPLWSPCPHWNLPIRPLLRAMSWGLWKLPKGPGALCLRRPGGGRRGGDRG
jgi:hypothetical protein